ncbi:imidazoleglycerol-phosphate dehydratase [Thermodesulfomicrobium sp. WS]|jgi:imidazoleglycerol-phosphate dehydratase|uniref:imidazoleglycerol-phosphate dehydratase HisB n=1 Tax=Thermodesulfomicrobium sp. WS TaxID=3004129 RepID=UPI00249294B6|nr:imidazoleglycerol-phosphate dehydratase HisB [Thermodesulfomicrobium sp. WS]BDV00995.1 imidazoleglycerol-phosphate dehydratase [Thermodesulfomicrobium sp. WS]
MSRHANIRRRTTETAIEVELCLDGQGRATVATGYAFADHMLTLCAHWAGFDLAVRAEGDLAIDAHHTVEDVGLCLGDAMREALGDRIGIARVGAAFVPMDEALARVVVDFSGRPYLVVRGMEILPPMVAGEEADLWREFWKSFAVRAGCNLHVELCYGTNAHHVLEAAFKAMGLALRQAVRPERSGVLSTKGGLDV